MGMQFSGCSSAASDEQSTRHISLLLLFTMRMSLHSKSPFMGKQCSLLRQSASSFLSGSISSRISPAVSLSNVVKTTSQKYCLVFLRNEKRQGLSETKNLPLPDPIARSSSSPFSFLITSRVCSNSSSSVFLPSWGADLRVIFRLCVSTCDGTRRIMAFFIADMPRHKWVIATWFFSDVEPTNAFRRCPVQYRVLCCPSKASLSLLFIPSIFWLSRLMVLSSSETSLQTNSPSMRQKPRGPPPTVDRWLGGESLSGDGEEGLLWALSCRCACDNFSSNCIKLLRRLEMARLLGRS